MELPDGLADILCGREDVTNPLLSMGTQISVILVIAQFFELFLKPLGQPSPIAQILAGVVLGPSMFSRIKMVEEFFQKKTATAYYKMLALLTRMIFMFMIGLEIDIPSTLRNLQRSSIVALGAGVMPSVFAAAVSPFVYNEIKASKKMTLVKDMPAVYPLVLVMIVANSASPVIIRMAAELRLTTTDVGRLAISTSLINDICCLLMLALFVTFNSHTSGVGEHLRGGFTALLIIIVGFVVFRGLVWWHNKANQDKKYMTNAEILIFLALFFTMAILIEMCGQSSLIGCFIIGLTIPRKGKTARTLLRKFSFAINIFVLPIYFGFTGYEADLPGLFNLHNFDATLVVVLVSMGGKISGTLAACHHLKIPLSEGVVLAFLLNLKGFVDLHIMGVVGQSGFWPDEMYNVFVTAILINTVLAGSIAAYIVHRESAFFGYNHTPLALQSTESELRILACVHDSRHVSAATGLISMLAKTPNAPITPFLIHLLQLHERAQKDLTFHQVDENEDFFKESHDYGGNDVVGINRAVDAFISETGVTMRQDKIVSLFATMYEEVCKKAEDFNATVILLSFHKHQRIDGKMENVRKEGFRMTNQKLLRHAPCTVAILVNRGTAGTYALSAESVQHVAVLFFGGPDDQEAIAFGTRIGLHPYVNLTVIRFLHAASKEGDPQGSESASHTEESALTVSSTSNENENQVDNAFVSDFYNRYVTTGHIGFVEKYVHDGAETVSALRDMGEMYSLFIVGKGGRGHSPITTGMSDWEECPELGKIGDLLASSDFDSLGSILVIQQQRHSRNDLLE